MRKRKSLRSSSSSLVEELRGLIAGARQETAAAVNLALTWMYWRVGERLRREVLGGERAGYGEEIVVTVSRELTSEFGRGFSEKNLRRMIQFAEQFPDDRIVVTLSRQLSWSHFLALLTVRGGELEREFYAEMARLERWSVRTLRERIGSMLFERTALSRKPEETIRRELKALREQDVVEPAMVLKDPYVLDFLGLEGHFAERDFESAILRELEAFLLEMGAGFSFVERQKRIQVDGDDFYLDLLFYNRKLRRLVAVELKQGAFRAEYKGQMELYLRWLAKHEKEEGEQTPLGIILCAGKNSEQIELLELGAAGIHVAEYMTLLPNEELLQRRLHQAIRAARERFGEPTPDYRQPASRVPPPFEHP